MKRLTRWQLILVFMSIMLLTGLSSAVAQTGGGSINVGDTITTNLGGDGDRWSFEGTMGDTVIISMTSAVFDTVLELIGPDRQQLISDDDSGGSFNAMISGYTLPATGNYIIIARGFAGGAVGEYTLSLQSAISAQSGGGTINIGDTVVGELVRAEDRWTFVGRTGDIVTIDLISPDFDAFLELNGPGNVQRIDDDDSGDGLNSRIVNYMLRVDGTYTLTARGFGGATTGSYTLSIAAAPRVEAGSGVIQYGATVSDNIVDGEGGEFVFSGTAGDLISITMSGGALRKSLALYDPSSTLLTTTEDNLSASSDPNAIVLVDVLPETGDYTIVARDLAGLSDAYNMRLVLESANVTDSTRNLELHGTRGGAESTQADIIYINGILTTFDDFEQQLPVIETAFANAGFEDVIVTGIYNATNNDILDVVRATDDIQNGQLAAQISDDDPAVMALVEDLAAPDSPRPLLIVGHSQGTAMVAAALRIASQQQVVLDQIMVFTFGNIAETYPDGPTYIHCIHNGDVIAQASVFADGDGSKANTTIRSILGPGAQPDALFVVTLQGIEASIPNHELGGYLENLRPGRCLPLGG